MPPCFLVRDWWSASIVNHFIWHLSASQIAVFGYRTKNPPPCFYILVEYSGGGEKLKYKSRCSENAHLTKLNRRYFLAPFVWSHSFQPSRIHLMLDNQPLLWSRFFYSFAFFLCKVKVCKIAVWQYSENEWYVVITFSVISASSLVVVSCVA